MGARVGGMWVGGGSHLKARDLNRMGSWWSAISRRKVRPALLPLFFPSLSSPSSSLLALALSPSPSPPPSLLALTLAPLPPSRLIQRQSAGSSLERKLADADGAVQRRQAELAAARTGVSTWFRGVLAVTAVAVAAFVAYARTQHIDSVTAIAVTAIVVLGCVTGGCTRAAWLAGSRDSGVGRSTHRKTAGSRWRRSCRRWASAWSSRPVRRPQCDAKRSNGAHSPPAPPPSPPSGPPGRGQARAGGHGPCLVVLYAVYGLRD